MPTTTATNELSEKILDKNDFRLTRETLEKFERSKILELYFARLDGRIPEQVPSDHFELYNLDLNSIKTFLLGQHPQDSLLQRIFKMMS